MDEILKNMKKKTLTFKGVRVMNFRKPSIFVIN
jgi:hypothetical protein